MTGGKEGKYYDRSDWQNEVPRAIYFYYAVPKADAAGGFDVTAYIWVNPDDKPIGMGSDLTKLIGDLAKNARGKNDDPRPIGKGFTVPWWKKSYFVVALEDPDGFKHDQALGFRHIDAGHERENHTFFDGWAGTMKDADGKDIAVAWTINYMKTRHGENLEVGEVHKFKLSFASNSGRLVDEGDNGTNMGPPIGPPPPP
jgi:hypothetical protein